MRDIGAKLDETMIDGSLPRLKKGLDILQGYELRAVELPVHGLDAIRHGRLDSVRVTQVRELLNDYNFSYSTHAPDPIDLMDRDDPDLHVAVLRASIEFALLINARALVYHPGRFVPEALFMLYEKRDLPSDEKRKLLDREALLLQRLAEAYPEMTICLENARPYLFHSPYCYAEQLGPLADQVEKINRENVKINLDFGHLNMAAAHYGFDPVKAVEAVRQHIGHTHIHDNFGKVVFPHEKQQTRLVPFGKGDAHMPVGWGEIPFAEILAAFIEDYAGMFMMELRERYFDSIPESRDRLQAILASCALQQVAHDRTMLKSA